MLFPLALLFRTIPAEKLCRLDLIFMSDPILEGRLLVAAADDLSIPVLNS